MTSYFRKEKYYQDKPAMATRQCSMKVIETLNNLMPNLVGGSADLMVQIIQNF